MDLIFKNGWGKYSRNKGRKEGRGVVSIKGRLVFIEKFFVREW